MLVVGHGSGKGSSSRSPNLSSFRCRLALRSPSSRVIADGSPSWRTKDARIASRTRARSVLRLAFEPSQPSSRQWRKLCRAPCGTQPSGSSSLPRGWRSPSASSLRSRLDLLIPSSRMIARRLPWFRANDARIASCYGVTSGTLVSPGTSKRSNASANRSYLRGASGSVAARNGRA